MKKTKEFADRLCYSIFKITLPQNTARKNIDAIVRAKLASVYPLSLHDKTILVLKNAGDKNSRIAIVCNQDFFDKNKQRICSSILAMKLLKKKTGTCVCVTRDFIEYTVLEQGRFISGTAVSRTEKKSIFFPENTIAVISHAIHMDRTSIQEKGNNAPRFFDAAALPPGTVWNTRLAGFSAKQKRNKIIMALVLAALLGAVGMTAAHQRIRMIRETRMTERSQAEDLRRRETERKEKELLEKKLKAEYSGSVLTMLPDMFDVCSKVFSSIDAGTKINNLTITGSKFQFDAHGNDAIKILTQYEENDYVAGIHLNRVAVEGEENYFTFEGDVKRRIILPNDDDSLDSKITFYQNELARLREEAERKQSRRPSEISAVIREIILRNQCRLASIQYHNTEHGLEIEYAVEGKSSSFFAFLHNVSTGNEYLVISSLRMRSYLEGGTLSAVIRFRTGIMADAENMNGPPPDDAASFTPEELAEYFIRRKSIAAVQEVLPEPEIIPVPSKVRNPDFLQYVGSALTSQGEQFALIKDTRKNAMIKFSNNAEREYYFLSNDGNTLQLAYEGTIYEVRK